MLPGTAHRGGAGSVRQRRQTEHGPAPGPPHSGRHWPGDQRGIATPVRHRPDRRGHRAPLRARRRRRTPPRGDDRARRGHAVPGPEAADAAGDDSAGDRPGPARNHRLCRQHRALLLHPGVARRRRGGPGPRRSRPPPGPRKQRPHHHAGERRQARRTGHLRALRAGRGAQPALPVGRRGDRRRHHLRRPPPARLAGPDRRGRPHARGARGPEVPVRAARLLGDPLRTAGPDLDLPAGRRGARRDHLPG